MAMFMGLVDGDGYIEVTVQKQYSKNPNRKPKSTIRLRLVIRLHNRDRYLLTYLRETLGVGSIDYIKNKNQTRYIICKRDLVRVIIPLIRHYNLRFLNSSRIEQFNRLNYILNNGIVHWDVYKSYYVPDSDFHFTSYQELIDLDFFLDWVIGFTMAEGSFGVKSNNSAFFSIKQKGIYNYEIIKAICYIITGRLPSDIKPCDADCYQLTLSSKKDVDLVLNFFSDPNNFPLMEYKLQRYNNLINYLKNSNRYKDISYFSSSSKNSEDKK